MPLRIPGYLYELPPQGLHLPALKDGDYSYNVTKTGYNPILGNTFTVSGGDKNVDILLFPLSAGDSKLNAAAEHPNPFDRLLTDRRRSEVKYIKAYKPYRAGGDGV